MTKRGRCWPTAPATNLEGLRAARAALYAEVADLRVETGVGGGGGL